MSCQRHPDRPRQCNCFNLCVECAASFPIACTCPPPRKPDCHKPKTIDENPHEPVEEKPAPAVVAVEDTAKVDELTSKLRRQSNELIEFYHNHLEMKAEYQKTIEIQNRIIDELQQAMTPRASSEDVKALESIAQSVLAKSESATNQLSPEIDRLRSLTMSDPTNEEIKRQILERTERLSTIKKEVKAPVQSRIEELAKPKNPKKKSGKTR